MRFIQSTAIMAICAFFSNHAGAYVLPNDDNILTETGTPHDDYCCTPPPPVSLCCYNECTSCSVQLTCADRGCTDELFNQCCLIEMLADVKFNDGNMSDVNATLAKLSHYYHLNK
ncbi:hypothetical protein V8F20_003900 [Naviculisporaceae sp. PSN 640]